MNQPSPRLQHPPQAGLRRNAMHRIGLSLWVMCLMPLAACQGATVPLEAESDVNDSPSLDSEASYRAWLRCSKADAPRTCPPGTIVAHIPATEERYIGSPSLLRLQNGVLFASHDVYTLNDTETPSTHIYRSDDGGRFWKHLAKVPGQFWSSLFEHRDALYLLGTAAELGDLTIRRSSDAGQTWTTPADRATGTLRAEHRYHAAPTPVLKHNGRLWRAVERVREPFDWPEAFQALLLWADMDADLLSADSWHHTNAMDFPQHPTATGWLEGNPVATAEGRLVNMLRVHQTVVPEHAALIHVSFTGDGGEPQQDAAPEFVALNGGSKKFSVRYDPISERYLALTNVVNAPVDRTPAQLRNRLALASSANLRDWQYHVLLLEDPMPSQRAFQYVAWQFDEDDLIFVSRTAFADEVGGAPGFHDANYLTFHRVSAARNYLSERIAL